MFFPIFQKHVIVSDFLLEFDTFVRLICSGYIFVIATGPVVGILWQWRRETVTFS